MEKEIEKIRNLISSSYYPKAFKNCKAILKRIGDKDFLNRFTLTEARFNNYRRQYSSGHHSNPTEINDIIKNFIDLLSEIEENQNPDLVVLETLKPYFPALGNAIKTEFFNNKPDLDWYLQTKCNSDCKLQSIDFKPYPEINLIKFEIRLVPIYERILNDAVEEFLEFMDGISHAIASLILQDIDLKKITNDVLDNTNFSFEKEFIKGQPWSLKWELDLSRQGQYLGRIIINGCYSEFNEGLC